MIQDEFFHEIQEIDKNLNTHYEHLNKSKREFIFAKTLKLGEEVGELQKEILGKFYKRRKSSHCEENLELEFADVFICLGLIAKSLDIDLNSALRKKLTIIKERGGI